MKRRLSVIPVVLVVFALQRPGLTQEQDYELPLPYSTPAVPQRFDDTGPMLPFDDPAADQAAETEGIFPDGLGESWLDYCTEWFDSVVCWPSACVTPTWRFYGDILFMRPRDAEVPYAVTIDGLIVPPPAVPIQIGALAMVDPDYEPAFRAGFSRALNDCTSVSGTYTHFESRTTHETSTAAPNVIRSLVSHPSSSSAATDFLRANARYDIDFHLADMDFRHMFACGETYALTWLMGARYAGLHQEFQAEYSELGTETVSTDLQFHGGGIRVGLEGEWHAWHSGFMIYGRGAASFVAGQFRGTYFQGQTFDPTVVDTRWDAGCVVSMLDLELGLGWASPSGCFRFTAGYLFSGWNDVVRTSDLIAGVQTNNFRGMRNTLAWDGLTARAEIRF